MDHRGLFLALALCGIRGLFPLTPSNRTLLGSFLTLCLLVLSKCLRRTLGRSIVFHLILPSLGLCPTDSPLSLDSPKSLLLLNLDSCRDQTCQTCGMWPAGCKFDMLALDCTWISFLVPWPENSQGSKLSNHLFPIFWDYSALLCAVDCLVWILVFSGRK